MYYDRPWQIRERLFRKALLAAFATLWTAILFFYRNRLLIGLALISALPGTYARGYGTTGSGLQILALLTHLLLTAQIMAALTRKPLDAIPEKSFWTGVFRSMREKLRARRWRSTVTELIVFFFIINGFGNFLILYGTKFLVMLMATPPPRVTE